MTELRPAAVWTPDCQGKQDFDGPILSISTRYWPAGYGPTPSANVALMVDLPDGEQLEIKSQDFAADTETEVKALVEAWAQATMEAVVRPLIP